MSWLMVGLLSFYLMLNSQRTPAVRPQAVLHSFFLWGPLSLSLVQVNVFSFLPTSLKNSLWCLLKYLFYFNHMHIHVGVCRPPGAGVMGGLELLGGCWESSLGLRKSSTLSSCWVVSPAPLWKSWESGPIFLRFLCSQHRTGGLEGHTPACPPTIKTCSSCSSISQVHSTWAILHPARVGVHSSQPCSPPPFIATTLHSHLSFPFPLQT